MTIKLDIINCLIKEENPLILSHIAQRIKRSPQLTEYHVKQLIDQKIMLCATDDEKKKYYYLTIPFYNEELISSIYISLTPVVENLSNQVPSPEYETIVNTLNYLLQIFIDDASKQF